MADIYKELKTIQNGRWGSDIRDPIHDAIEKINNELEAHKQEEDGDNNG